ncbi:MAG: hypothetical protein L6R41_007673 [Letrouitia leprolyta]|nr:MAG: hypothetical protein L6R41_007673 [Letrouitia leprolyta]
MDQSAGLDCGLSNVVGSDNRRTLASGRQLNRLSSVVNSTLFSADDPAYRNAVEHPESARAISAWERSSMPTFPDTPLEQQCKIFLQNQLPSQADQVSSAVSNCTAHALDGSPVLQDIFKESVDISGNDDGAKTSSLTRQLPENVHVISRTSTPEGHPRTVRPSKRSPIRSPASSSRLAPLSDIIQSEDSIEDLSARRSLNPSIAPEPPTDQQRSAPQEYRQLPENDFDPYSNFQWIWPVRELRKPQLVSERVFEDEARKIRKESSAAKVDEPPLKDLPLYDNLLDKMRQKTVETWLLRSEVACLVEDWGCMETYARQAQKLAIDLQWEPFIAQCAFPIGKALYMQNDLLGAFENLQEVAEKTQGYYVSRAEIRDWLITINAELETSWPKERPPSLTPLTSVVEEKDGFRLPRAELGTLESEFPEDNDASSSDVEASVEPPEFSVSSGNSKERSSAASPEESNSHLSKAGSTAMQEHNPKRSVPSQYVKHSMSKALNNLSPALTARHGPAPTAIRLASNPMPASIGSPRLYDPAQSSGQSPPLRGNSPQLRSGLLVSQTYPASGLSEMLLPDAALPSPPATEKGNPQSASEGEQSSVDGGVPLPSWTIPQQWKSDEGTRQPLNPSLLFAKGEPLSPKAKQPVKARNNEDGSSHERDVQPTVENQSPPSTVHTPSTDPVKRNVSTLVGSTLNASPTETSQAISPLTLNSPWQPHSSSTNDIDQVASQPAPPHSDETHPKPQLRNPPTPFSPNTTQTPTPPSQSIGTTSEELQSRINHIRHLINSEDAEFDAKIQKVIAVASPLVRSARSAGISAISPGWQRPWEKGRSAYAVRPKSSSRGIGLRRAISERAAVPRVRQEGVVERTSPPRRGPGLKWQDGWTRGGNVPTGRVLSGRRMGMGDGATERYKIKDEPTRAGGEGNDRNGHEEGSKTAEGEHEGERDEVVGKENNTPWFWYDLKISCALM